MSLITLTTDFGTRDWFVGTMKGVIAGIAPRATIVDLTHEIPSGDIRGGAFALMAGYRFFPKGTIHVAVVDPGVGSGRAALVVQTADYFFVGPDNGVLSFALTKERIKTVRRLSNDHFFLRPVSRTFHGRDVFAPVAAWLSRGTAIRELGPLPQDFIRLEWPKPVVRGEGIEGEVMYVDRFGNAITNLGCKDLPSSERRAFQVRIGRRRLCGFRKSYDSVPNGKAVAVMGSSAFLEIAVNGGSAAERFGLKVGQRFRLARSPDND